MHGKRLTTENAESAEGESEQSRVRKNAARTFR
jgi:hypothetical protein